MILQSQLLDADAAPRMDATNRSSRAILRRMGSGPPTGEDIYCEERAREVCILSKGLPFRLNTRFSEAAHRQAHLLREVRQRGIFGSRSLAKASNFTYLVKRQRPLARTTTARSAPRGAYLPRGLSIEHSTYRGRCRWNTQPTEAASSGKGDPLRGTRERCGPMLS